VVACLGGGVQDFDFAYLSNETLKVEGDACTDVWSQTPVHHHNNLYLDGACLYGGEQIEQATLNASLAY
jgi:hypothetical protein